MTAFCTSLLETKRTDHLPGHAILIFSWNHCPDYCRNLLTLTPFCKSAEKKVHHFYNSFSYPLVFQTAPSPPRSLELNRRCSSCTMKNLFRTINFFVIQFMFRSGHFIPVSSDFFRSTYICSTEGIICIFVRQMQW